MSRIYIESWKFPRSDDGGSTVMRLSYGFTATPGHRGVGTPQKKSRVSSFFGGYDPSPKPKIVKNKIPDCSQGAKSIGKCVPGLVKQSGESLGAAGPSEMRVWEISFIIFLMIFHKFFKRFWRVGTDPPVVMTPYRSPHEPWRPRTLHVTLLHSRLHGKGR